MVRTVVASLVALLLAAPVISYAQQAAPAAAAPADKAGPTVNINTATSSELEGLPGVGPKLAQRIIDLPREEWRLQEARRPDERPGHRREELPEAEEQAVGDAAREALTLG